jgi:BMFP domain-containing protein YqiC
MNQEALVSDFIERLQRQIRDLLPSQSVDAVLEQARRTLRQGIGDLELVSRQELEGHLNVVRELRQTVHTLEQRIRALEDEPTAAREQDQQFTPR